jgi:hypothetical protein
MSFTSLSWLLSILLTAGALWVISSRFRSRTDANWPLIFYLLLVVHANMNPAKINPYVLYSSVVLALFLRFEFMNERITFFLKAMETLCLLLIAYWLFQMIAAGV